MGSQRVKIRGLATIAAWVFSLWGGSVVLKGLYDLVWGVPDANAYAPFPWAFVSKEQWLRYGGFELAYGLACLGMALFLVRFARFLPETVARSARDD